MKYIKIFLILIIFFIIIIVSGKLVSLKYINDYPEGSFISDYYYEENNHDIIFLGDCEAYTSFSPIELYKEYGITSFVRGSSRQLIGQSYYILSETLKYEKPKLVILSVGGIINTNQIKEEYNRLILDKMKLSREKYELYKYSKMDKENFLTYLFPILRYHDRITSLNGDDIKYLFKDEVVSHNGFLINQNVKPLTVLHTKKNLSSYEINKENIKYLDKIRDLCKDNNITLILEKSPTAYPYWYSEYDKQIKDYAIKNNLDYYNFLEMDTNIDYQTDTYDSGTHLNLNGAKKITRYFGNILKDKYGLQDHHSNDKINKEYEKKIERYEREINEKNN